MKTRLADKVTLRAPRGLQPLRPQAPIEKMCMRAGLDLILEWQLRDPPALLPGQNLDVGGQMDAFAGCVLLAVMRRSQAGHEAPPAPARPRAAAHKLGSASITATEEAIRAHNHLATYRMRFGRQEF